MTDAWLPALLLGLAVAVSALTPPSRLNAVLRSTAGRPAAATTPAGTTPASTRRTRTLLASASSPDRRRGLVCAAAAVVAALLVGGTSGIVLGALLAAGGPIALASLEPVATRQERDRVTAELPFALDLLSACLAGGAAPGEALRAVSAALPGPLGDRMAVAAARWELGSPPSYAWAALIGSDPDDDQPVAATVRLLVRAAGSGTPVAAAMARLADDTRRDARARGERAAARAGVLVVGPLGLCFLPAFVLLGIVPVVLGLVGPVLDGFSTPS